MRNSFFFISNIILIVNFSRVPTYCAQSSVELTITQTKFFTSKCNVSYNY